MHPYLAMLVLAVHLGVIGFNVAGLVVIPLGAKLGWRWVRIGWLRLAHLAALALVAAQAAAGRACFLTDWQDALSGGGGGEPLIMRAVNAVVFWPLPIWVFTAAYAAVFVYAAALWRLVPPRPAERRWPTRTP